MPARPGVPKKLRWDQTKTPVSGTFHQKGGPGRDKFDWPAIRELYYKENLSLRKIAELPGMPSYKAIEAKCSKESWVKLRQEYQAQRLRLQNVVTAEMKAAFATEVDEVGGVMVSFGATMMKEIMDSPARRMAVKPSEAIAAMRIGIGIRLEARRLDRVDIKLSDLRSALDLQSPDVEVEQLLALYVQAGGDLEALRAASGDAIGPEIMDRLKVMKAEAEQDAALLREGEHPSQQRRGPKALMAGGTGGDADADEDMEDDG